MGRARINGTRRQVYNGTLPKTKTGLTKDDLMQRMDEEGNPYGSIISLKKHLKGLEQRDKFMAWREANMSRVQANQFKPGHVKVAKGTKLNNYTPKKKNKMLPPPPRMPTRAMSKRMPTRSMSNSDMSISVGGYRRSRRSRY